MDIYELKIAYLNPSTLSNLGWDTFVEPCQLPNYDMETLELYNLDNFEKTSIAKLQPSKIGDQHGAGLEDLDPSLELAVDLSEYIKNTGSDDLFPDIFQSQSQQLQRFRQVVPQSMPHAIGTVDYPTSAVEGGVVKIEPTSDSFCSTVDLSGLLSTTNLVVTPDYSQGIS